jgi:hypothetical protein
MPTTTLETLLPILVLVIAVMMMALAVYDVRALARCGWRQAFVLAAALFGVLIWLISEGLGALRLLNGTGLWACWLAVSVTAAVTAIRHGAQRAEDSPQVIWGRLAQGIRSLPVSARLLLGFLGLAGGILAIVAFTAAPNTWDSMTYHLSRVMHWQQDQSLRFYATGIQRQLAFGPWAEMAVLQFQLLAGGDRLANFVQYFSMLGCALGVSLLAEQLGGGIRAQLLAGVAAVSMPMVILQATSTQNDLVAAFWCTAFVNLLLTARTAEHPRSLALPVGATAGLAVLTKATSLIFLAPFGAWLAVELIRRLSSRAWQPLLISLGVAGILLSPQSLRNINLYGNPLGSAPGPELSGYTNDRLSIQTLTSNVLRTMSLQLAVPSQEINDANQQLVRNLHALLRMDPDDPLTTWDDSRFEITFSMYEDNAANPLHFLYALAGLALLVRCRSNGLLVLGLCLIAAWLLFSLVVRWQPWNSRLVLPLLVLAMAQASVAISMAVKDDRALLPGVVLAAFAIPYLIANPTRPVFGDRSIFLVRRVQQYFANVPDDPQVYLEAAGIIRDERCEDIGLDSPPDGREYLLWATNRANDPRIRIEHVLVQNASRRYGTDFAPCAIVVTHPYADETLVLDGVSFDRRISTERFSLFLHESAQP